MAQRRIRFGALAWVAAILARLFLLSPWRESDAGGLFVLGLVALSFPLGFAALVAAGHLMHAIGGPIAEGLVCCSAYWWVLPLVTSLFAGYLQWFVLLPWLLRVIRKRAVP